MNQNISVIKDPKISMVKGFHSNAVCCQIKKKDKLDLGIVLCDVPARVFGMYTTNRVKAAPVILGREHIRDKKAQALIVNCGYANACTGEEGIANAKTVCSEVARVFGIRQEDVIPASTGTIGPQLPMDKIIPGIKGLKDIIKMENDKAFSRAIMTTDTVCKIAGVTVKSGDQSYSIVGTAKGSGMIAPNMATMLCFIFTDAAVSGPLFEKAFKFSVNKSLNCVTIDGDMSTNDSALVFSSGLAGNKTVKNEKSPEYGDFTEALTSVTTALARQIAFDGEGATKLIEITVKNAKNESQAHTACMKIANSALVKTAFFGEDANWGRIICALGYSGIDFELKKVQLHFNGLLIFENGQKTDFSLEEAKKILQNREIKVIIDLNNGPGSKTVWTSDLSYDYVKINASYTT